LATLPISSITPAIVVKTANDIHKRDVLETVTRIFQHLNGDFRYAQAKGLCRDNPPFPSANCFPARKTPGGCPLCWIFSHWVTYCAVPNLSGFRLRCAHGATAVRLHCDAHRQRSRAEWRDIDYRVPLSPEIADKERQAQSTWLAQRIFHPGAQSQF
jgi:Phage integrase central domain